MQRVRVSYRPIAVLMWQNFENVGSSINIELTIYIVASLLQLWLLIAALLIPLYNVVTREALTHFSCHTSCILPYIQNVIYSRLRTIRLLFLLVGQVCIACRQR